MMDASGPSAPTAVALAIVTATVLSGLAPVAFAGSGEGEYLHSGQDTGTEAGDSGNASRFALDSVSGNVSVGESGTITVAVENVGDRLVRNATATATANSPDVRFDSGNDRATVPVGAVELGEIEHLPIDVTIDPTAEQRRYTIDLDISYQVDGQRQSETLEVGFRPGEIQEFEVRAGNSSLYVDETGTLRGELANDGGQIVDDAVLVLEGGDNGSDLVTAADDRQVLGEIVPGQSESFAFDVAVGPNAEAGPRQFSFHVEYVDEEDRRQRSETLIEEWTIRERRDRFELEAVESDLRVDDEGNVTGQLRYRGEEAISDAVVVLADPGTNATGSLSATETEYAVGDLADNETANFGFEIGASPEAVAGQRQFTFRVRYVDEDGTTRRSDSLYAQVEVAEEREVFAVRPVESSVEAGSSSVVRVEVTNVGDETVRDVSAKLFVDEPLTADDDEAFVPELGADESATLAFRVSVAGDALAKTYPLSIDFEYEDADGDVELSETYQVGLEVTQPEDDGFGWWPFALPGRFALIGGLFVALGVALVAVGRR